MAKRRARDRVRPSKPEIAASAGETAPASWLTTPRMMALVLLTHLVLMGLSFDPTIFTGGDNGVYVALSRALLETGRYISLHDPSLAPHTYYPPGYPILLALASLIGIHPWVPIKLVTVAFCALGVAMSALWMRRETSSRCALLCALVLAASPGLLLQGQLELSDVPFWGMTAVALWALARLPREDLRWVAVAGVATAMAYLTRSAALPFIVAVFAWMAYERRWRQLLVFAALVLPVMALWTGWKSANGAADLTYGAYANTFWLKDHYAPELGRASLLNVFVDRPLANASRYGGTMIPLLLVHRSGGALLVLGLASMALAIGGWAQRVRRPGLAEVFFPLYAGMLFVLPPVWAGERYLFPIYPLALVYAAEAGTRLVARWGTWVPRLVAAGVVTVLVLAAAQPMGQVFRSARLCTQAYRSVGPYACLPPVWQDYLGMAEWAKANLPADAVLISRKPGLFFALSDRRGIDIPKTTSAQEYLEIARKAGASYLVLDQIDGLTDQYSIPVLSAYPETFCVVQTGAIQGAAILGFRSEPPVRTQTLDEKISLERCPLP